MFFTQEELITWKNLLSRKVHCFLVIDYYTKNYCLPEKMACLGKILEQIFPVAINKIIASYLVQREWNLCNPEHQTDALITHMAPAMRIVSIKQLTLQDVEEMDKKIKVILFDDDDDLYGSEEELQSSDFILAEILFYACPEKLIVYHGFPGDNPYGVLCYSDKGKKKMITDIGESVSKVRKSCPEKYLDMAKLFVEWYWPEEVYNSLVLKPEQKTISFQ